MKGFSQFRAFCTFPTFLYLHRSFHGFSRKFTKKHRLSGSPPSARDTPLRGPDVRDMQWPGRNRCSRSWRAGAHSCLPPPPPSTVAASPRRRPAIDVDRLEHVIGGSAGARPSWRGGGGGLTRALARDSFSHLEGVSSRSDSTCVLKEFSYGTAVEVPYGRGTPLKHQN